MKVFVYKTLKQNKGNDYILRQQDNYSPVPAIGYGVLYNLGSFPCFVITPFLLGFTIQGTNDYKTDSKFLELAGQAIETKINSKHLDTLDNTVHGELIEVGSKKLNGYLDSLEGYIAGNPRSLYSKVISVFKNSETNKHEMAWVYVMNMATVRQFGAHPIENGKWE